MRFGFGKNWDSFLNTVNSDVILQAEKSLEDWLAIGEKCSDDGKRIRFLDIGCGSGLFSLAAKNLGADVKSFDYDINSVRATQKLKDKYYKNDVTWNIEQGDVLDRGYLSKYGEQDIVYSWGVLHHTGDMYKAFENVSNMVKMGGCLYISIYNDQGVRSKLWRCVKGIYNIFPPIVGQVLLALPYFVLKWGIWASIRDIRNYKRPGNSYRTYYKNRGMSPWHDTIDWIGGYPFQVATPEEIVNFFENRGFVIMRTQLCGKGHGCNHYLFRK